MYYTYVYTCIQTQCTRTSRTKVHLCIWAVCTRRYDFLNEYSKKHMIWLQMDFWEHNLNVHSSPNRQLHPLKKHRNTEPGTSIADQRTSKGGGHPADVLSVLMQLVMLVLVCTLRQWIQGLFQGFPGYIFICPDRLETFNRIDSTMRALGLQNDWYFWV